MYGKTVFELKGLKREVVGHMPGVGWMAVFSTAGASSNDMADRAHMRREVHGRAVGRDGRAGYTLVPLFAKVIYRDTENFGNTWGGFTGVILDTEQATLFCDCESEFVCYTTDGVHDPGGNPLGAKVEDFQVGVQGDFQGVEVTASALGGADG